MEKIDGFKISKHEKSKRIIDIKIEGETLEKLIFPFNKFDITALEYKPFTRFTIAKSLDDLTDNKLSKLINSIISHLQKKSASAVFRATKSTVASGPSFNTSTTR